MRQLALICVCGCFATPVVAEEEPSLLEQGAQMFLEGLMQEMEPALEGMQEFGERLTPSFRKFMSEMGPALTELLDKVEDWSVYEAPVILENGDIIIRRKAKTPDLTEDIET